MSFGVHEKPKQIAAPTEVEDLEFARGVADADLVETTAGKRYAGWTVEKPDHRFWSYVWAKLWRWLLRLSGAAFFIQCCQRTVSINGTVDIGDQREITIDGTAIPYTTTASDTTNTRIAASFAAVINAHSVAGKIVQATAAGQTIILVGRAPAVDFTLAVAVLVDVGTADAGITFTTEKAAPYAVTLDPSDPWNVVDFAFGSQQLDQSGDATENQRFVFDKSKGFFAAGSWNNTNIDDANRGTGAAAFGASLASGFFSFASGQSTATGAGAFAAIAGEADGDRAAAIGASAAAPSADSMAIGTDAVTSADSAMATGHGANAGALASHARGGTATAPAVTTGRSADACGEHTLASGAGAGAYGRGQSLLLVTASGDGSTARCAGQGLNEQAMASGSHSDAQGIGVLAAHDFSRAHGAFTESRVAGHRVRSGGTFKAGAFRALGDGQTGHVPLAGITTGAGAVLMGQDPQVVPAAVTFPVGDDTAVAVRGDVIAVADDGGGGLSICSFSLAFVVENDSGAVTVKAGGTTAVDPDGTGWTLPLAAVSGAVDGFSLSMNGAAATTIWWQGEMVVSEVKKPH